MLPFARPHITAIVNGLVVRLPEEGGPQIMTLRCDDRRILTLGGQPEPTDTFLDASGMAVYPGLINAHDHLEMNHYPRTKFQARYPDAHAWGEDFLLHLDDEPFKTLRALPLTARCHTGGTKNRVSGVTTVAHHNPYHPPLRQRTFPVAVRHPYAWAHSLHFEGDPRRTFRQGMPWMIHLAEGTNARAAGELRHLDQLGLLRSNTVLIHGVGLSKPDQARVIEAGSGLVWCPSSNLFLLGETAQIETFRQAHRLAIGSDSCLTADGTLLDELRAAYATGQVTPLDIFRAVTVDAARLLMLTDRGRLAAGLRADFFLAPAQDDPFAALIALTPEQITFIQRAV
jgi:cytosine/adenosine deaminase-related metal-dependent hydrolase